MNKLVAKDRPKAGKAPSHPSSNSSPVKHRLIANRLVHGKELRQHAPRSSHAEWTAPADRADPIEILIRSSAHRVKHLLPIRYGRMLQSPFAFYRGAAAIMAADLAHADHGLARAALRRLPPDEFRHLRHARAAIDFRHQRFRRDRCPARGNGM